MIENIIFLGAGASCSEGAPSQSELLKEYFSSNRKDGNELRDNRLCNFFNDFFKINVKNTNLKEIDFPTFEEILGILELALNRKETFKDHGSKYNISKIQQIREDIILLITSIIESKLKNKTKFHKKLVKRLIAENKILNTAFISLNYDIIIDNALADIHPKYELDYGIEFTNFVNTYDDWNRPNPLIAVNLYKPHGSLNWLYCPTCITTKLTPYEKRVVLIDKPEECEKCGGETIPIIIPPTYFKDMSNRYLQEIWYKMEDTLKQAKNICFCGYSFPDADIHIKYLLKRAEINGNHNLRIYVVNSTKSFKELKLVYKRFFKNQIYWSGQSFEEFAKDGFIKGFKRERIINQYTLTLEEIKIIKENLDKKIFFKFANSTIL